MIDQIALWVGYSVMVGSASLIAGTMICFGMKKLFWRAPREVGAFIKFLVWKAKGKPEAPKEQA